MELLEKPWPEILMGMSIGQEENFPWDKRRTIRGAISDRIKNDFPEFEFTTKKIEVRNPNEAGVIILNKYLRVRRKK